jgi:hypothetical protein
MSDPLGSLLKVLNVADATADIVLPLLGQPELAKLVDALSALLQKVSSAVEQAKTNHIAAEVAAADVAAQAAEVAAGLK